MSRSLPAPARRLVEPAFLTHPVYVDTFGPEVADICDLAGFPPDPQQQLLLDLLFAFDSDGLSIAFEYGWVVARQNLKTGGLKQAALGWLFVTLQPTVVWSAHEMATTRESHRELAQLIEGSPALSRYLPSTPNHGITVANGKEQIELRDGRRLLFRARTHTSGRGLTGHKVILDEAFALQPEHTGSLYPTLIAVPDPQVVLASSAGLKRSAVLRDLRDRGRVGAPRVVWAEWCAPREECEQPDCQHAKSAVGCALDREHLIRAANPSLTTGRIQLQTIRDMRQAMPPEEYARECFVWWDDPEDGAGDKVPATSWRDAVDVESQIVGVPAFAVEVQPGGGRSAVCAAGRTAGGLMTHVEVLRADRGTGWVAPYLEVAARRAGVGEVCLDPTSAAGALVPDIEGVGLGVRKLSSRDVAAGCVGFAADVVDGRLRHLDQQELNGALAGACTRDVGDGLWVWSRISSLVDISPLYGVTLARWALLTEAEVDPWVAFV